MGKTEIPQFKTLEEEKAYWEERGPFGQPKMMKRWTMLGIAFILAFAIITLTYFSLHLWAVIPTLLLVVMAILSINKFFEWLDK